MLGARLSPVRQNRAPLGDLSAPFWALHPLKGDLKGHWALTVNGNWRMVFAFDGMDAALVDYEDYH